MNHRVRWAGILCCLATLGCSNSDELVGRRLPAVADENSPNILLVVVDDMGYSDLGSFGSEINTPILDQFAKDGLRFTNFHATPMCATTRAALLTGQDHHFAGVGGMDDGEHLNDRVISIAKLLEDAGYHTSMSGKWHLGQTKEHAPSSYGFTRSFALMGPGANHFNGGNFHPRYPSSFTEDGRDAQYPEGVYSTEYFTARAKEYITEAIDEGRPFFSYLALTAPHAPLQAPKQLIANYRGKYDSGYEELRAARVRRMEEMGLLKSASDAPYLEPPNWQSWDTLSDAEKSAQARTMEVYAAMVESVDQSFADIVSHLRLLGELENTLIIFLSDNGANGGDPLKAKKLDWNSIDFNNELNNIGSESSNVFLGTGWAAATTAPFKLFKWYTSEGGIRTSAFVWGKELFNKTGISSEFVSVVDVFPTILDVASTPVRPEAYLGRQTTSESARSWMPYLKSEVESVHASNASAGWEFGGNRAVMMGTWKILHMPPPFGNNRWQLYNLATDIGETQDVAEQYPQRVKSMLQVWSDYAAQNTVITPEQ